MLHREADPATPFPLGREVASLIPGAVLVPLPGAATSSTTGDWSEVLDATLGFLGAAPAAPVTRSPAGSSRWPGWSPRG